MKILAIISLLFIQILTISAKDNDGWTLYPCYNNITEIEPTGSSVFVLASNSLFSYNLKDGSLTVYNKANSLSDFDINHIAWNKSSKKLVVAYSNGNIDLISANGDVVNIPDLYLKNINDSKTINHIYIYGTDAYLSLPFGIIKINTQDGSILDTYQLGFNITYSYIDEDYIYAASNDKGLYRGYLKDNLLNKNNWERIGDYTANTTEHTLAYDDNNKCWWTVKDDKLTYYTLNKNNEKTYHTEGIRPEGPASNRFYHLYPHANKLYAAAGAWSQERDNNYMGEVHVWDGENWEEFEQPSDESLGHRYRDVLCLDFDPQKEGHVMVGSKSGLYEFQNGKFIKCYNKDNSALNSPLSKSYTIVSAVKYDKTGRLWVFNSLSDTPILSFNQAQNEWSTYAHSEMSADDRYNLTSSIFSKINGNLWFVNNFYEKNKVYNYNYTNDEINQYGPSFTNEDGTILTPIYTHCITEDKNGNLWIGTTSGPLYLSSSDIRNGNNIFTQHKVPRNDGTNYADYLLSNTNVRSIAVDGANQKWMGTDNGVYLISDDCNTQIYHFTTENSPLMSNIVYNIAINDNTGEVYFATNKGLCSYRNNIVSSNEEMTKDNVYAYPNPVKPDYTGNIHIVGLSLRANIKIVSVNGSLVHEGKSTGGTYTWNGCDLNGKKVASGIYMVETATEEGEKGCVCKIAIIR